ncbi:MAG: LysM peptidoglycan-binding domain-containing protein [Chloroflexota bacterium]
MAGAPEKEWQSFESTFQRIANSVRFNEEAVLRATDATPPPTPTPTPTPVIYVVQPGDTLSGISVLFDIDIDSLANRNGIEDYRSLRSGQELVIPTRR